MSDPYSDEFLRILLDRDNLSNPAPFSVPSQTAQTSSSYNDCESSASENNDCTFNDKDRDHIGQWITDRVVSSFPPSVIKRKRPRTKNFEKCADISEEEIKRNNKYKNSNKKRDYGHDPARPLRYDSTLSTRKFNGSKRQFWFFLMQFLVDPSKRNALSWTGNGREFIITKEGEEVFTACWSKEQNKLDPIKWDSVTHKFRDLCREGILTKIDTNKQYTFATEPSFHVGMTPDELTKYIAHHNINSPGCQLHTKESIYAEIDYYLKQIEQEPSDNSSLSPFGEEFDEVLNSYLTPTQSTESFYNFPQSSSPTLDPLPSARNSNNFDDYSIHPQNVPFNTLPSPSYSETNEYPSNPSSPTIYPLRPIPPHQLDTLSNPQLQFL